MSPPADRVVSFHGSTIAVFPPRVKFTGRSAPAGLNNCGPLGIIAPIFLALGGTTIKRLIFVCAAIPMIIACSRFSASVSDAGPFQAAELSLSPAPEEEAFVVPSGREGEDAGLSWYRNKETRHLVEAFYGKTTGSLTIACHILDNADRYDIPVSLAFSLCWAESKFNPKAVNRNYGSVDRGLFQLNSQSFPHLTEKEFFDPKLNAQYGLRYLRTCLDIGGNEIVALAMYNAGRDRVVKQGAPVMTLEHISAIIEYRADLERDFLAAVSPEVVARSDSSPRRSSVFRLWGEGGSGY